jgi:hypothetical protein
MKTIRGGLSCPSFAPLLGTRHLKLGWAILLWAILGAFGVRVFGEMVQVTFEGAFTRADDPESLLPDSFQPNRRFAGTIAGTQMFFRLRAP